MYKISVLALVLLISACAARNPAALEVRLVDDGYLVAGKKYASRAELAQAIRNSGITSVRLEPYKDASYSQVEQAVLAIRDAGADIGLRGNVSKGTKP